MHTSARRTIAIVGTATLLASALAATALPAAADDPVVHSITPGNNIIYASFSDTSLETGNLFTIDLSFLNFGPTGAPGSFSVESPETDGGPLFTLVGCSTSSALACAATSGGNTIEVDGPIPNPGGAQISVELYVNDDVPAGTYPLAIVGGIGKDAESVPSASFTVTAPPEADLGVDLSASAGPLLSSQISYTLETSNAGPGDATSSTVEIDLPAQTYSVSLLPAGCTYTAATDTVTCDTGAIADGSTTTSTFRANLALLSIGSLNATATRVGSSPADPNPANDTSTAHCGSITGLIIGC
jgi:hypothetical protein